uniref:PHD-type domain-containing protein n=1 Tax=Coccidioides posadasii RMSCC 3488 TaxID=454284 RepID=A0A0J6FSB4_COCPO|nr:hypothetical protein CPAG_08612 [Coccidioides posadasii RMSCC 3488]
MNWDHPIHSFTDPNVEPQTPTRTPTVHSFDDTAFQTPKFESSFYDPRITWNTADPYASSPELSKAAHRFDQTPNQRAQNPLDPTISRHRQIDHATRAIGSDDASTDHGTAVTDSIDSAKRSAASMQTPPPTSTIRRKNQDRSNNANLNLSTPVQPTYTGQPLETPSRVVGFSPGLFGLQDSPDPFNLSSNPTTASPFFSRHQMPWNHESNAAEAAMDISDAYGDPFGPSNPADLDIFEPTRVGDTNLDTLQLPVVHGSAALDSRAMAHEPCTLEASHAALHSSIATSPRPPPLHGEDPSMFLSSPARRFGYSEPIFSPPLRPRVETRQPYHYQTEVSERERRDKELKRLHRPKSSSRRQKTARVESASYVPQGATGKPIVKRSATHSGAPPLSSSRHQRQSSFSSAGPVIGGGGVKKTPSKGRTSPLKTQLTPLAHPPPASLPAPMESLVLKISKDGLATTEMKLISDSPTRLRPGLRDTVSGESSTEIESDSSDEEPDYMIAQSQNPSFAFPDNTLRRPDFVRAQSTSRPHSKGSSYSSAAASSHSGQLSPWTGSTHSRQSQLSSQPEGRNQKRRPTQPGPSHSRSQSMTDSDATYEEDGAGDAQHALMQVLKGRKRQSRPPVTGKQSATSSFRPSTISTMRSSPPSYGTRPLSRPASSNSPTVTDPAPPTPAADRQNNPSTGTRCVCNSMNNGGHLMIQCDTCAHWLHTKCVGLDRQRLPPVYVCVYCTQTPSRGVRLREPFSISNSSPLARKSYGGR